MNAGARVRGARSPVALPARGRVARQRILRAPLRLLWDIRARFAFPPRLPMTRLIRSWVEFSMTRFPLALAGIGLVTAVLAWRGAQIEIDPDLKSLLPADAPSVLAIEEASERRGGIDLFVVAVASPDPQATVDFMDALDARLRDWEEVEWTEIEQNRDFFREHALLYLPVPELERMLENLKRMRRERTDDANPLYIDLAQDAEQEPFDASDSHNWVSEATLMELNITRAEISSLFPFAGEEEGSANLGAAEDEDPEHARIRAARQALDARYDDYKLAPHGRVGAFTAKLRGRSTDIEYAERVFEHVSGVIDELDPASYHPEMRAVISGAYRSFDQVEAVGRDMITATSISIGLVLVLLIAFFRSARSVVLVLSPLLVGVAWTLGAVELVYGRLNTLTAFIFSMLIGMGIDFGIHIYRRTLDEFHAGATWQDAMFTSISVTGRALFSATVTTVLALLTLTLAHFDGFNEFGIACGLGVALCLASTIIVAPPLLALTEAIRRSEQKPQRAPKEGAGAGLMRGVTLAAIGVLAFTAWSGFSAQNAEFEHNFRNLEAPSTRSGTGYGQALGRNRSSAPGIILGDNEAQMRELHQQLRARFEAGDEMLRGFQTIESIVPGDQDARLDVIDEIAEELDRRAWRNAEGEEGEMVNTLLELVEVDAFTIDDLPEWSRRGLIEKDGSIGAMGLLYGNYDRRNAREVIAFQDNFGELRVQGEVVPISSNGFIIADVVRFVKADAASLGLYVALALLLILILDLRSLRGVVACMSALTVAVLMTIGAMVLFDIKIGLYNMVVLPTVLGVGIDGAIHLYHRAEEVGTERMGLALRTTGMAVAASSITTAAGFFGLILVKHRGVQTIGQLAVVGILASFVAVWTVLPAMLVWMSPKSSPRENDA